MMGGTLLCWFNAKSWLLVRGGKELEVSTEGLGHEIRQSPLRRAEAIRGALAKGSQGSGRNTQKEQGGKVLRTRGKEQTRHQTAKREILYEG